MTRELLIGNRLITDDSPAFVIAECGGTHNGDIQTALQLIRLSADAGADAAKFQKRDVLNLYAPDLLNKPYDNDVSYGATYGLHRLALEFDEDDYRAIAVTARDCGITWFATAFDEASCDVLMSLDCPMLKIHSGGLTDIDLLTHCASYDVPMLVSTGGGTIEDIDRAHDALSNVSHAFLHATAAYPLKPEEANLRMILTLRNRYPDTVIGFSSHSPGIAFSLIAYAFGARIIEQHVTTSRAGRGTDHGYALEPKGLETLCEDLRKLQVGLGDGVKRIYASERAPIAKMRRVPTPDGLRIVG